MLDYLSHFSSPDYHLTSKHSFRKTKLRSLLWQSDIDKTIIMINALNVILNPLSPFLKIQIRLSSFLWFWTGNPCSYPDKKWLIWPRYADGPNPLVYTWYINIHRSFLVPQFITKLRANSFISKQTFSKITIFKVVEKFQLGWILWHVSCSNQYPIRCTSVLFV